MLREFFLHGSRLRRAWAWLGLLVFLCHHLFKVWLKLALNNWYQSYYDVLQTSIPTGSGSGPDADRSELRDAVYTELVKFVYVVAPAVVVHPVAGWLRNLWIFAWRRALIERYLELWDVHAIPIEGASQRTHEDTQRFATGVQTCVANVLDSVLTLIAFGPVLCGLDPSLFWLAFGSAGGGLMVSWIVGSPLVDLEVANQRVEAELRRDLVILEASPQIYRFSPPQSFAQVLRRLAQNYNRLYRAFAALQTWLTSFDQAMVVVPYLAVAPRLFADAATDRLSLGQLVQVTNAFGKVFESLNVVSDSWLAINEWRSVLRRLTEFERALGASGRPARSQLVPPGVELSDTAQTEPAAQAAQAAPAEPATEPATEPPGSPASEPPSPLHRL